MSSCSNMTRGDRGILLYEVMVAVAVLSLGLVVVLRSFVTSLRAARTSQNYLQAMLLLEEKLWELKMEGAIPLSGLEGEFLHGEGEFRWEVETVEPEAARVNGLTEVKVTVLWNEGSRERSLQVMTFLIDQEEGWDGEGEDELPP